MYILEDTMHQTNLRRFNVAKNASKLVFAQHTDLKCKIIEKRKETRIDILPILHTTVNSIII